MLEPIIEVLRRALGFFYEYTHDYTISVILLTLVIKLFLHPLTRVQLKSMKAMQMLAPHMESLRRKYKDDPKTLNQEMMALYRAHNVNPMMGCLPMLVQLPVIWGLFRLLYTKNLFGNATVIGVPWLRLDDIPSLSRVASEFPAHPERSLMLLIPILVGLATWWQQRLSVTDPQQAKLFLFMPLMLMYFATLYPIGLSIYWIVSTVAYVGEYRLVVGRPQAPAGATVRSPQSGRQSEGARPAPGGARSAGASSRGRVKRV